MSWSKTFQRTTKPEPYDEVMFCGICGIEVHVQRRQFDQPVAFYPVELIELRVEEHLACYHAFRFWLWRKLGRRTSPLFAWLVSA